MIRFNSIFLKKYFIRLMLIFSGSGLLFGCFPESDLIDTPINYYISGDFDTRFFYLKDLNNSFGAYIPDQNMIVLKTSDDNVSIEINIKNINRSSLDFPFILPGDSSLLSFAELKLTPGSDISGIGGKTWSGSTNTPNALRVIIENFNSRLEISGSFDGVIKDFEGNKIRVDNGRFSLVLKEILL